MVSRREKRKREKLLDRLIEPAPLNYNKGPVVPDPKCYISNKKKARKGKGRKRGKILKPMMKWKDIHIEAIEPEEYWDEWATRRDGQKNWSFMVEQELEKEKKRWKKQKRNPYKRKLIQDEIHWKEEMLKKYGLNK